MVSLRLLFFALQGVIEFHCYQLHLYGLFILGLLFAFQGLFKFQEVSQSPDPWSLSRYAPSLA
jgi:hypothetical protein